MFSMAYINFDSGILAIPIILLSMLALGIIYPIYDFLKERKFAALQQKPKPGADILLRNIMESQFLSYFLFFVGIIFLVSGISLFFLPNNITWMTFIRLFAGIVIGGGLMFTAQRMQIRFENRVGSWRKNFKSSANHGLESTGAPPAAKAPETHP